MREYGPAASHETWPGFCSSTLSTLRPWLSARPSHNPLTGLLKQIWRGSGRLGLPLWFSFSAKLFVRDLLNKLVGGPGCLLLNLGHVTTQIMRHAGESDQEVQRGCGDMRCCWVKERVQTWCGRSHSLRLPSIFGTQGEAYSLPVARWIIYQFLGDTW